jgi:hypothetical protein
MVPKALVRLMFAMVFPILLIALGLAPGLFQALTDALRRFPGSFSNPPKPSYQAQFDKPTWEPWIVVIGLVLIALNLAEYLWSR